MLKLNNIKTKFSLKMQNLRALGYIIEIAPLWMLTVKLCLAPNQFSDKSIWKSGNEKIASGTRSR